jgi:hypothetical protein
MHCGIMPQAIRRHEGFLAYSLHFVMLYGSRVVDRRAKKPSPEAVMGRVLQRRPESPIGRFTAKCGTFCQWRYMSQPNEA